MALRGKTVVIKCLTQLKDQDLDPEVSKYHLLCGGKSSFTWGELIDEVKRETEVGKNFAIILLEEARQEGVSLTNFLVPPTKTK